MKRTTAAIMMALALGMTSALAQPSGGPPPDDGAPPPGAPPGDNSGQGDFRPPRPPRSPLLMALDVNHDGIIDSNEIANASAELLTLDKNHDGQLTPDEYRPKHPNHHGQGQGGFGGGTDQGGPDQGQRPPPPDDNNSSQPPGPPGSGSDQGDFHPHRPPRFPLEAALDVNGDGIIDSNEIANASAELLTLDKNHDGQLTPDEYLPKRPHGRGFGGPPPGDGPDQGGPGEGQPPPPPDDGGQPPPGPSMQGQ